MNELTYLFGAGASCNSMPLVNNFFDRFQIFLKFIRGSNFENEDKFVKDCEEFISDVKVHLSFDTFFKKLFHQSKTSRVIKSKNILLLYFVFEHLIESKSYSDMLFLQSAFVNSYYQSENEFNFESGASVYHLNGFINHPIIKNGKSLESNSLKESFSTLLKQYFSDDDILSEYSSFIRFSWETYHKTNGGNLPLFVTNAMNAIKNSHAIIVIGYSFPLYNRLYDSKLFANKNLEDTTIYIQDLNPVEIEKSFRTNFKIPTTRFKGASEVISLSNCNSFFVPHEVMFM